MSITMIVFTHESAETLTALPFVSVEVGEVYIPQNMFSIIIAEFILLYSIVFVQFSSAANHPQCLTAILSATMIIMFTETSTYSLSSHSATSCKTISA